MGHQYFTRDGYDALSGAKDDHVVDIAGNAKIICEQVTAAASIFRNWLIWLPPERALKYGERESLFLPLAPCANFFSSNNMS